MKIALVTTYKPIKCGIATHAYDLRKSIVEQSTITIDIIAIDENSTSFPNEVVYSIERNNPTSYDEAVEFINQHYDHCIIQHEYGIFGGISGDYILRIAKNITIALTTIFHTILRKPSLEQEHIINSLAACSKNILVMTNYAVNLLIDNYRVPADKIHHIPHGVPIFDFNHQQAKKKIGITDKIILLSFGFLGNGKGFETAIEAVSLLNDKRLVYIILGTTHPNVQRHEGEKYRESLITRCKELQIDDQVIFINEFASDEMLSRYLTACDIYITPYPNEEQISSGTLSFAVGAGAAVISTPYIYAKDLLKDEIGLLFDFQNSTQLATHLYDLITSPSKLKHFRDKAKRIGINMQWPKVGKSITNILKD